MSFKVRLFLQIIFRSKFLTIVSIIQNSENSWTYWLTKSIVKVFCNGCKFGSLCEFLYWNNFASGLITNLSYHVHLLNFSCISMRKFRFVVVHYSSFRASMNLMRKPLIIMDESAKFSANFSIWHSVNRTQIVVNHKKKILFENAKQRIYKLLNYSAFFLRLS